MSENALTKAGKHLSRRIANIELLKKAGYTDEEIEDIKAGRREPLSNENILLLARGGGWLVSRKRPRSSY